ncbi:hypothetical protein BUY35_04925 [Staphylococcus cohnii]|nr:hypothetical protein BUY35_04925 [Staphylococcus cohnii]
MDKKVENVVREKLIEANHKYCFEKFFGNDEERLQSLKGNIKTIEDIAKPICEEKGIAIDDFMIEVQEV